MSIDAVEQNPEGDDVVHISDPGQDRQTEPSGGQQALDSISHIVAHGKSKDLRRQPGFEHMPDRADKAAYTGTRDLPERFIHDEAVQVRQLLPTDFSNRVIPLVVGVTQSISPKRPERMSLALYNNDLTSTCYIGNSQVMAQPGLGFPLPPGGSLVLDVAAEVWASTDGNTCDLRYVETWRTDNRGN